MLRTMNSPSISNRGFALVFLVAVTACEPSTSSSTHWLTCQVVSDCVAPGATDCSNGYCVDANGNRIDSSTQMPAGGGATSSASPMGGNSARGGTAGAMGGSGNGGASGSTSAVCSGQPSNCFPLCQGDVCDCYCPTTGDSGGASAGGATVSTGGATSPSAGSAGASAGGATVSTGGATSPSAGSAGATGVCNGLDSAFIDSVKGCSTDGDCIKVQYQVNCCGTTAWTGIAANKATTWSTCLASRPAFGLCGCASTAPTTDDGRFVSYNGAEAGVSCIANKCQTRVVARSCGLTNPTTCNPDQLCASYETLVGPSSTIDYACITDPCTGKLDCTCGKSVCDQRTDRLRTCNIPYSVGTTIFVDIACQDTAQ
jgi:hypothetical protein